jgi:hypothetical protein
VSRAAAAAAVAAAADAAAAAEEAEAAAAAAAAAAACENAHADAEAPPAAVGEEHVVSTAMACAFIAVNGLLPPAAMIAAQRGTAQLFRGARPERARRPLRRPGIKILGAFGEV